MLFPRIVKTSIALCIAAVVVQCSSKETASAVDPVYLYPVKENGRWGYMDEAGKIVIQPTFDFAWDFSNGLGRIKHNGKYGFVDLTGNLTITPAFTFADDFTGDYTRVNISDTTILSPLFDGYGLEKGWTFINKNGIAFNETFAVADLVKNNTAAVKTTPGYDIPYTYVAFENGQLLQSERLTEAIFSFNGAELAPASDPTSGKVGMIDKTEQWIIQPTFDQIEPLSEGFAAARKDNRYGYIDAKGNWIYQQVVSPSDYYYLTSDFKPFSNGLASVRFTKDAYGFVGKDGREAFKVRYKSASSFTAEGYAIVSTEAGTGLIDTKGSFVITPNVDVWSVERGIVIYKENGGFGAKDLKTNKVIVKPQYSEVSMVGDLLKLKQIGANAGYIDESGKYVIEPQFDQVWDFKDNKAIVRLREKLSYIDKSGKMIADVPESESPYRSNNEEIYAWMDENGKFGFSKAGGEVNVIANQYDFATSFEGKVARVNVGARYDADNYFYAGGKWGIIDQSNSNVVAPGYELILPFKNGIAPFNIGGQAEYSLCEGECTEYVYYTCKGGKWGLVHENGSIIQEASYDYLGTFGENYLIRIGDNYGIIDNTGKVLYEPKLQFDIPISEEQLFSTERTFLKVEENGKSGVIDHKGSWLIAANFTDVQPATGDSPFQEGLALVNIDGRWGAIHEDGTPAFEAAYDDIRPFNNGMAAVKRDGKWGFINTTGTLVVPHEYENVRDFQGDVAIVQHEEEGFERIMNNLGEIVWAGNPTIDVSYEGFHEGLCVLKINDSETESCGLINSKGRLIFNVNALSEVHIQPGGLLYVVKDNKWAMATHDGVMLTAFEYDWIEDYVGQNLIRCNKGGEPAYDEYEGLVDYYGGIWGMLDKKGKLVVPMSFSEIGKFSEGLAPARSVEDLDAIGYVDFEGNVVRPLTK